MLPRTGAKRRASTRHATETGGAGSGILRSCSAERLSDPEPTLAGMATLPSFDTSALMAALDVQRTNAGSAGTRSRMCCGSSPPS